MIFDLLFDDSGDLRSLPLSDRKARLAAMLSERGSGHNALIRYVAHFETGGDAVLKSACRLSLEGIVSKKLDAFYQSGRSGSWTKAKCRAGHEVVIGGWAMTGAHFRSLLVGVHRGEYFVYIGRVGTGYSEAKIRQLMPRLKAVAAVFSRGKLTDRKKAIRPEQSFLASVSTRDARSLGPLPRITDTQRARKSTSRRAVLARHFPRRQS